MKKLLSASASFLALAFSLILGGACGNGNPGDRVAAQPAPEVEGRSVQASIDSLMRSHFNKDGPAVILAVQFDTPALHAGASFPVVERQHAAATASSRIPVPDSARFYSFATGLEDLTGSAPVTDRSVFNIGSLTKQFTAREIINLVRSGKIQTGAPIGKYLEGLRPVIAALTIQQLLSHCSGIPDHYAYTDTNRVKHATNKDVLDAVKKADTLYFPAGTRYRYSNTAYCLLGMLIEKCTGKTYEKSMADGLHFNLLPSVSFLSPSATIGNRVHGYDKDNTGRWREADAPESVFFTTQADGGLLISMHDYMQWCADLEKNYYSGRLSHQSGVPGFEPHTLADTAAGLYYGYGWFVLPRKKAGPALIYHTGFNGGFRTSVLLIPELGYRIAIFSASPGIDLEDLVHQINRILGVDDKGFIKSGPLES